MKAVVTRTLVVRAEIDISVEDYSLLATSRWHWHPEVAEKASTVEAIVATAANYAVTTGEPERLRDEMTVRVEGINEDIIRRNYA